MKARIRREARALAACLFLGFVWPGAWAHTKHPLGYPCGIGIPIVTVLGEPLGQYRMAAWAFGYMAVAIVPHAWALLGFGPRDIQPSRTIRRAAALHFGAYAVLAGLGLWIGGLAGFAPFLPGCVLMWNGGDLLMEWWPRQGPPRKRRQISVRLPDVDLTGKGWAPTQPEGAPT